MKQTVEVTDSSREIILNNKGRLNVDFLSPKLTHKNQGQLDLNQSAVESKQVGGTNRTSDSTD